MRQAVPVTARNRIDDAELLKLLYVEKRSQADCARHFSVSDAAITQRLKLLGVNGARRGAGPNQSTAPAHIEAAQGATLNLVRRLEELDSALCEELVWVRSRASTSDEERQRMLPALLQVIGEIRRNVGTCVEISRATAAIENTVAFREHVLGAIDELADEFPALKARLLERLRERTSLRRALTMNGVDA